MDIRPIRSRSEIEVCAGLIRASFATVAERFALTRENAPTHPSFMTAESLSLQVEKGLSLFGLFEGSIQIGCVGVEASKSEEGKFYLERLAVLPEKRRSGRGRVLVDFAVSEIRKRGGGTVGIAIIDEQADLKSWYVEYGFRETGIKRFPHLPFTVCFLELREPRR